MPDGSERRQFGRYLIVLPILHKPDDPAAGSVGVGWTRNVGEGGTCVDLAESLRLQTPLRVRLQTDQGTIELEAHVVWTGEPSRGGGGVRRGPPFPPARADAPTPPRAPPGGGGGDPPGGPPPDVRPLSHVSAEGGWRR